jgi:hypothetical protein
MVLEINIKVVDNGFIVEQNPYKNDHRHIASAGEAENTLVFNTHKQLNKYIRDNLKTQPQSLPNNK